MKLVRVRRHSGISIWGVIDNVPHREIVVDSRYDSKFTLVQAKPRDPWAIASNLTLAEDIGLFERFGWMPFKVAIVKMRLLG